MSKYTTETRFVCEQLAGGKESVDFPGVDSVLANSWDKVFTTEAETFDPTYKAVLCKKILKHYWFNEIGMETVGMWKLAMNTKFEEIIPFYNLLYKAEEIKFNPLHDTDITTTSHRDGSINSDKNSTSTREGTTDKTGTVKVDDSKNYGGSDTTEIVNSGSIAKEGTDDVVSIDNTTTTDNGSSDTTVNNTKTDLYSDTPQGALTGVLNQNYLTNARQITDNGTTNTDTNNTNTVKGNKNDTRTYTDTTTDSTKQDTTHTRNLSDTGSTTTTNNLKDTINDSLTTSKNEEAKNTEDWVKQTLGKSPGVSMSTMLIEYRKAMINIDMLVVEEFADCFMGLW